MNMSLDTLFEHILLTEQQVSENIKQLHEGKAAIKREQDKIQAFTEDLKKAQCELDNKALLLSEARLQLVLITKRQEQLKKQRDDLLREQRGLKENLERLINEEVDERKKLLNTIATFNDEFNLTTNSRAAFNSQVQAKNQSLELQADSLRKEMDLLRQNNTLLSSMENEVKSLQKELLDVQLQLKGDVEKELKEATSLTECLKMESLLVRQKPLTDSSCIRMKKELQMCKEEELELLRETLSTEIQSLQLKISQTSVPC